MKINYVLNSNAKIAVKSATDAHGQTRTKKWIGCVINNQSPYGN